MTKQNRHPRRLGRNSSFSSSEGFTLIEVLVALALLAVGLTTLIELFSGSLSLAHSSRVYTTATFLANQKMGETLLSEENQSQSGNFEYPYEDFSYTVELDSQELPVTMPEDSLFEENIPPMPSLKKIRVTVSWEENHRERKFYLETLQAMVINYETEE
jgi:general secretion pathway protein I